MARRSLRFRVTAIASPILLVWIVAGCGSLPPTVTAPEACRWPPDTPLAFAGRSTLGTLGIGSDIKGPENERLPIYVTAGPMSDGFREFCAVRPDGSLGGSVPDGWEPPLLP